MSIKLTSKSASSINDYLNSTTVTGGTSGVVVDVVEVSATDGTDEIQYLLNIIRQEQIIQQQNFLMVKQLTSSLVRSSNGCC